MDSYLKTIQKQSTRKWNYDNIRFVNETLQSKNLPDWTYCSDMGEEEEEEEQKGKELKVLNHFLNKNPKKWQTIRMIY